MSEVFWVTLNLSTERDLFREQATPNDVKRGQE